jgi:hypothetical protein
VDPKAWRKRRHEEERKKYAKRLEAFIEIKIIEEIPTTPVPTKTTSANTTSDGTTLKS